MSKSKETSKKGRLKDDDIVKSDFLNCKVDANLTKEEQRKVVQSVELTKALVLMGYQTWSDLEPGKFLRPSHQHTHYYKAS